MHMTEIHKLEAGWAAVDDPRRIDPFGVAGESDRLDAGCEPPVVAVAWPALREVGSHEEHGYAHNRPVRINAKDTPVPYHPNLWAAHRPTARSIAAAMTRARCSRSRFLKLSSTVRPVSAS